MVSLKIYSKYIMDSHKYFSENEEMYLVTIAKLNERGFESPVALAIVANELAILPVSANQMVRKLEKNGLVAYTPYKGVELTETGSQSASRILRQRRLWEVFLIEHLSYSHKEADEIACRLEHIFFEAAADRLADYLAYPKVTPSGMLIPDFSLGVQPKRRGIPLSALRVGEGGAILYIEAQEATKAFLHTEGLVSGVEVRVQAVGAEGAMLVEVTPGCAIQLSSSVVSAVWVKPTID
jgi:DtxR family Mn-dependent transcriptional regulator